MHVYAGILRWRIARYPNPLVTEEEKSKKGVKSYSALTRERMFTERNPEIYCKADPFKILVRMLQSTGQFSVCRQQWSK